MKSGRSTPSPRRATASARRGRCQGGGGGGGEKEREGGQAGAGEEGGGGEGLTAEDEKKMRVAGLREACEGRGLSTKGLKAVLLKRLLAALKK